MAGKKHCTHFLENIFTNKLIIFRKIECILKIYRSQCLYSKLPSDDDNQPVLLQKRDDVEANSTVCSNKCFPAL